MSVLAVPTLDAPLVFVDIETNGLNQIRGRVIEVAAIRVEDGEVVRSFQSLIDPETELPYFITTLTGITTNDLKGAPTFHQIADELEDIMRGAIFVAHNVRFDYSFLKQEFKRLNRSFLPKQLCTVKLSRALYPHERSHKLESLIQRHGLAYARRHRAYDDAAVLWQFMQHVCRNFPPEIVEEAVHRQIRQPALPKALEPTLIRGLPTGPGVYIFEDEQGKPLYVGKSINIKKRVLSHFARDHAESKEFKISQHIQHISTHETPGELSALLLESKLVKELQPLYNRQLRKTEKLLLVRQSQDTAGYIQVKLEEANGIDPEDVTEVLAVYPRRGKAKQALNELLKVYDLCPKLLGLEKAAGACFLYQLHKCRGACLGREEVARYNARLLTAFERQRIQTWPFDGAIVIEEKTDTEVQAGVIVDQWCVVGDVTREPYCEPNVHINERAFDLDTYKILRSFISDEHKQLKIKLLRNSPLAALLA